MIRILIVAEIRLYREGLALALAQQRGLAVTGAVPAVHEALDVIPTLEPDIVLLDMIGPDALAGVQLIVDARPETRVVALGVANAEQDLIACAEAGVAGYVLRDASVDDLAATVQCAARGELRCSPRMAASLLRRVARLAADRDDAQCVALTRREDEILVLIDQGLSNKEIAARLFIEVPTVKNHVHNILEKLGARRRSEAAAKMRRHRRLSVDHASPGLKA